MPRLSIVIPVLGSTTLLEEGLVSVLQHRPDDCEVLVVLAGEYDDPYNLRDEDVRFVDAGGASDWLSIVNRGLAVAGGEIVHLLACGAEVQEGWADRALVHFDDAQIAAVTPLVLNAERRSHVLTAGVRFTAGGASKRCLANKPLTSVPTDTHESLGPSAIAAFYRTETLSRVGDQLDAQVGPALADVDLALRLRQAGYQAVLEPSSQIVLSASTLPSEAAGKEHSRHLERLFWRHLAPADRLASVARHALSVLGESIVGIFTGRVLQTLQGRCQGACDALFGKARYSAARPTPANDTPRSLRIDTAQRAARKRNTEASRPLRRSA